MLIIGDRIGEGAYTVHSRFRHAVNFACGSRLATVVDPGIGPGPLSIVSRDTRLFRAARLHIDGYGRIFTPPDTEPHVAARYGSSMELGPVDRACLRRNLRSFRRVLIEQAAPRSLAFLLDASRLHHFRPGFEQALAAHLREGVRRIQSGDTVGGVRRLSGCGFGLTPSGDDFICGMLIALRFAAQTLGVNTGEQVEAVYRAARTDDLLCRSFLDLARDGCVDARTRALLTALAGGREQAVKDSAVRVLSAGATSGADTATGLLMTMERT